MAYRSITSATWGRAGTGTIKARATACGQWFSGPLRVAIALIWHFALLTPLYGQTAEPSAITLPDPLTPEAISTLVSRLSDAEVRQLLLDQLGAAAAAGDAPQEEPRPSAAEVVSGIATATITRAADAVRSTPTALSAQRQVFSDLASTLGDGGVLWLLSALALAGLAGVATGRLFRALIAGRRGGGADRQAGSPMPAAGRILVQDLATSAAVFVGMLIVIQLLLDGTGAAVGRTVAFWLVLLPLWGADLLRAGLAPFHPERRLAVLDDALARYLFRNLLGVLLVVCAAVALYRFDMIVLAAQADGGTGTVATLGKLAIWVNLVVFGWLGIIVVRARAGLSSIIRGRSDVLTGFERWLAAAYPWLALGAIILTWATSAVLAAIAETPQTHRGQHLISLVILLAVPLLDTGIRAMVHYLALPIQGEGAVAEQAYAASLRSYKRMARVVVFGLVIAISTRLWDINLFDIASDSFGAQVASHLIRALLICAVGYLIWEIIRLIINRKLARERTEARVPIAQDDVEGQGNAPISSRLATVLPPISWTLQAVVITMTVLTALGNIGIDVTPLLAGAGIAGIAIGFGAQKLVADIVSGIFFLFDDAFRLNEYIDAGGTIGTVEKISLRSIRLRDDNGPQYCIPYSEISRVTNFGRDWGIMKLKFTVPFDTDPEKVRKIFKRIGQEMLQNPALADSFIEPFKSQGVKDFNDTGMVVRGKFKFKPGTQFAIRKEVYRRVQQEFAAAGIEFARREVRVKISGGEDLTPDQASAVAASAAQAAQNA